MKKRRCLAKRGDERRRGVFTESSLITMLS